jgi:hypothetical protein
MSPLNQSTVVKIARRMVKQKNTLLIKQIFLDKMATRANRLSAMNHLLQFKNVRNIIVKAGNIAASTRKKYCSIGLSNLICGNFKNICIMIALVSTLLVFLDTSFIHGNTYMTVNSYVEFQVNRGDTVWSIASQYTAKEDDIRDMILAIRKINNLNNNAQIYPGQILKVPN